MAKLRGDDDIMSLMNELSSNQGYLPEKDDETQKKAAGPSLMVTRHQVRLVDVDDKRFFESTSNIWNPFEKVDSFNNVKSSFIPTNPTIEIFRRRAYERFKEKFKKNMELASGNSTKPSITNMWKKLSIISLMERWHFNLKLKEELEIQKLRSDVFSFKSIEDEENKVHAIFNQMENASGKWVDPILISNHIRSQNNTTVFNNDFSFNDVLAEEIKFEWTRAWRREQGTSYVEKELEEVFTSKQFRRKISGLSRGLREAAMEILLNFRKDMEKRSAIELTATKKKKKRLIPKLLLREEDVTLSFSGLTHTLNDEHFRKLQILFDQNNNDSGSLEDHKANFASSLFALLTRYDMLQGSGLQSAIHGNVFDVLLKNYGCKLECFASPFNCRYEKYFSAFPDTDCSFGSMGSFFDFDFLEGGCFQANPPFASNFILSMANKMEESLVKCEEPLMFIIFIPCWNETMGWKVLKTSQFLQSYISLDQKSHHYYTEGTQHRRKGDRFRVASFDTSIFFLQNVAAQSKWKIHPSHLDEIKAAFNNDSDSIPMKRKQKEDKDGSRKKKKRKKR